MTGFRGTIRRAMDVFEAGHEQIVIRQDEATGLRWGAAGTGSTPTRQVRSRMRCDSPGG